MNMIQVNSAENLDSTQDYNELNNEISRLISLMSEPEEIQKDIPVYQDTTLEDLKLKKILDNEIFSTSPIWKNSPVKESQASFSTNQSSFNTSFCSSNSISPATSPIPRRLFVSAYSPIQMQPAFAPKPVISMNLNAKPFYSMKTNSNKYEKIFNSNEENVFVPRLDNERNIIHLQDIFLGKEQRTTLMIRHIPNKYTLKLFTEEINKNFQGKYDVFYLPIDYTNNCNLGFAFINFVNPMHIIEFYEAFRGKKWSKYLSDKRCELAFAKIQGKQNLMAHFEKGNVIHSQTEDKKPLILPTPTTLPLITLPLRFEEALKEFYPRSNYIIDSKHSVIVLKSFS